MLDQITPVILTYNEEANIERTLAQVRWAKRIVVIDSFSTDATLDILEQYNQLTKHHYQNNKKLIHPQTFVEL